MAKRYNIHMSHGPVWAVLVERHGVSDYRAKTTRVDHWALPMDLGFVPVADWVHFHSAQSGDMALVTALEHFNGAAGYVREMLEEGEQPRARLQSSLTHALALVEAQDARIKELEQYLLQANNHAAELAHKLSKAQGELVVASKLCVELVDQRELAHKYVSDLAKGDA